MVDVNSLLINRTVNGLMIPFYKKRSSKIFLGTLGFKKPNTALLWYLKATKASRVEFVFQFCYLTIASRVEICFIYYMKNCKQSEKLFIHL